MWADTSKGFQTVEQSVALWLHVYVLFCSEGSQQNESTSCVAVKCSSRAMLPHSQACMTGMTMSGMSFCLLWRGHVPAGERFIDTFT